VTLTKPIFLGLVGVGLLAGCVPVPYPVPVGGPPPGPMMGPGPDYGPGPGYGPGPEGNMGEAMPPPPGAQPGYVWVWRPGHWRMTPNGRVWRPGHYVRRPAGGGPNGPG